jgi:hypothetical protein
MLLVPLLGVITVVIKPQIAAAQASSAVVVVRNFQIGDLPNGVTGINGTLSCRQSNLAQSTVAVVFFMQGGTTSTLSGFLPATASAETSCVISASLAGTANLSAGEISIGVGSSPSLANGTLSVGPSTFTTSPFFPAAGTTSVAVQMRFYGPFVVGSSARSVSPTGQAFEISVACDKGGPKDVFPLSPGERRVYSLPVGTNCLATNVQSYGTITSYEDTVGTNTTDGRVAIAPPVAGCPDIATAAILTASCWAGVLITNLASASTGSTSSTASSTATATAATTTASTTTPSVTTSPSIVYLAPPVITDPIVTTTTLPSTTTTSTTTSSTTSTTTTTVPSVVSSTTSAPSISVPLQSATSTIAPSLATPAATPNGNSLSGSGVWRKKGLKPRSVISVRTIKGVLIARNAASIDGVGTVAGLPRGRFTIAVVLSNGRKATVTIQVR